MSLCRENYSVTQEAALNDQVNLELTASQVYLSMASHFSRDNVALPGLAKFFKHASHEEREHAEMLIEYQNLRGGRMTWKDVKVAAVCNQEITAVGALETALELELSVYRSLIKLHKIADEAGDAQMTDFLEGNFLKEQVEGQKELADMITQLKRVSKDGSGAGLGLYLFDQNLLNKK